MPIGRRVTRQYQLHDYGLINRLGDYKLDDMSQKRTPTVIPHEYIVSRVSYLCMNMFSLSPISGQMPYTGIVSRDG
jgi:hypothetical protein